VTTKRGWQRKFEDPIRSPTGASWSRCTTPATTSPIKEAALPEWQAAIEALMLVVRSDGPTMLARISVMRALNRGHVREFNPDRKDHHWGRRKLKRDQ
jgi:hypothetical protein